MLAAMDPDRFAHIGLRTGSACRTEMVGAYDDSIANIRLASDSLGAPTLLELRSRHQVRVQIRWTTREFAGQHRAGASSG